FYRGWVDTTLGIWSGSSVSPFNTLDSVKLTGALLSAIIYNSHSDSTATELMVVRALGGSELPTLDMETSTFAIATDSAVALIGSASGNNLSATFSTIPEPGSISLVALGGGLLLGLRRKISRQA
ncbi:MAG: PEP-CTERM sorting domain-containing protein, partial [Verrucomicrobia bacterium]|nr:PEP-CTERM sorting domain-containing protein [Verrucomicrobiota bacterium]